MYTFTLAVEIVSLSLFRDNFFTIIITTHTCSMLPNIHLSSCSVIHLLIWWCFQFPLFFSPSERIFDRSFVSAGFSTFSKAFNSSFVSQRDKLIYVFSCSIPAQCSHALYSHCSLPSSTCLPPSLFLSPDPKFTRSQWMLCFRKTVLRKNARWLV